MVTGGRSRSECTTCVYFVPHDVYSYVGICKKSNKLIVRKEACDKFKELKREEIEKILDTRGWIYCITCRTVIYSKEKLDDHEEDVMVIDQYSDAVASEESPAAD